MLERLGLQENWLTTAPFINPNHGDGSNVGQGNQGGQGGQGGNPGPGGVNGGGNFGGPGNGPNISYPTLESRLAKQQSADDFGIKDPQAIGSYFQQRSQFGVPANVQTPVPDEQKKPDVEINPHSMVSKSVVSIEASFNKQMQFELDDLRLSGNTNRQVSGLEKYKIDSTAPQNTQQGSTDLLKGLEDLKLDDLKLQAHESQEEARIKIAAEKSFLNHTKSNLNPFQNSMNPSQQGQPGLSNQFQGSQQPGQSGQPGLSNQFQGSQQPGQQGISNQFQGSQQPGQNPQNLIPGSNIGNMIPPSYQNSSISNGNQVQAQTKLSNLAFSNLSGTDKTIQDVKLASHAKDSFTNNHPSLDIAAKMPTLDKAPEKLPLNQSYNPTKKYDKDSSMMESYGKFHSLFFRGQ